MSKAGMFSKMQKAVNRLFNIGVGEVSLVDHPAIDEPFFEVKSKDGNREKDLKEENTMDEKKVAELVQSALQPLTESVAGLVKRLDDVEKSNGEKIEAVRKEVAEIGQKAVDGIKAVEGKVEEITVDAEKHFSAIDKVVFVEKGSQKINGQDNGENGSGEKSKAQWPTFAGVRR